MGTFTGVTHIQRVATRGGVAPAMACDATSKGRREIVKYQADYIFWKAA
jgi:endonuclease III